MRSFILPEWIEHLERAPEWSVVKPVWTCNGPTSMKLRNTDRCHQTHKETFPWFCKVRSYNERKKNPLSISLTFPSIFSISIYSASLKWSNNVQTKSLPVRAIFSETSVEELTRKTFVKLKALWMNCLLTWGVRFSFPLVPTEELRLMTSRSTSFLRRTRQAGASSGIFFTPGRKTACAGIQLTCMKHNAWKLP